ncbi:MAG: 1,6-anhydro-N-acetylmuramyl-L-alanine amidase AmpD [Woeseia sp.]|nr:1,6-anhydro-N-acetylmuramyl-L-alanine amidase AmpD [Woeseia sp.]MBT8097617.1 1,6-anhydro-N-acetylmuramyl-L-alanine amidase AmpD [Woeseia sp.]NNE61588.1 1,6-anhydro-N-acetylmuramyl-L-alanine amidase AmpD [Woeseia sp.]NNL55491.1 1,6-anhydro-N-acetylmuramyl-L-alanine amidase AmpD [Woeseia sp.]
MTTRYTISPGEGLIRPARQCPSPNQDERPPDVQLDLLVVHGISLPPGEFGGPYIEEFFCNSLEPTQHPYFSEICDMRVSAHLLLRRDGELVQFVPFARRAWHAGESSFAGRSACNDFSIGIELEGEDQRPYSDAQYAELPGIVSALQQSYPRLNARRIAGHCDIAPARKEDPGPAFDWLRLYDALSDFTETTVSP